MLGKHLIKSWSSTQTSISLSSGEAEFYGCVKAAGVGLGYQSLLQDVGVSVPLRVWADSTASIGICSRRGLGKLRHIATRYLWIQDRVRDKSFELRKVLGAENPADVFTKHLSGADRVEHLMKLFGCEYSDGRPESAPQLRQTSGTRAEEPLLTTTPERQILHDGRWWTAVEGDHGEVPEARPCPVDLLPHETGDMLEQLFPKAVACEAEEESEEGEDTLEVRGVTVGKNGGTTSKVLLSNDDNNDDRVKKFMATTIGFTPTARLLRRQRV